MDVFTKVTPSRKVINGIQAPLLEDAINQNRKKRLSKYSLIWGTINIGLLSIILFDITYTCPLHISYVQYIEYVFASILILNILYHFGRYLKLNLRGKCFPSTTMTLVQVAPGTPITQLNSTAELITPNLSLSNTPMNLTALSWMSTSSPNESINYPVKSDSWMYSHGSPKIQSVSPIKVPRQDTSGVDFISDEDSLSTYLKDFEANDKIVTLSNPAEPSTNILSTFWNHPIVKTSKDASLFLKRSQYQLSSPTATSSSNSPKSDDKSPHGAPSHGMEIWRRIGVNIVTLTQWNSNLRTWLSQTILQRMIKEFRNVDDALSKQGLGDIQMGKVGLDRLRKTAQTAQVVQYIPTLATVVPFLELTTNQEYLVRRIKELAKGGCMSEFKWNAGGSFNGKEWDSSLPTDSAIIMHLLVTYLDIQLLPSPSEPDLKPFTGCHFLKQNEKLTPLTNKSLLIQQCSEYPPHYKVIIGEETFELAKGYNNMFHSILFFLYFVNKKHHGMIGRVNLGKSGLNMLWIIES